MYYVPIMNMIHTFKVQTYVYPPKIVSILGELIYAVDHQEWDPKTVKANSRFKRQFAFWDGTEKESEIPSHCFEN